MALGPDLVRLLSKLYDPSSFVERKFRGYDIAFKTDEEGRPILLFIGTKTETGNIRGKRYARRLVMDKDGKVIKDHWDDKGKAV